MDARSLISEAVELHRRGDLPGAVDRCHRALESEPGATAALNLLGVLHAQAGNPESGVVHIRRASELEPDNADYLTNLGLVLRQKGDPEGAFQALHNALELPDSPPTATHALADLLIERGDGAGALRVIWNRLQSGEDDQDLWIRFAEVIRTSHFGTITDAQPLVRLLEAVLERPGIEYQSLTGPFQHVLWHIDRLAELRRLDESDDREGFATLLFEEATLNALTTGLPASVMRKCVIPEEDWERLLTRIRATLLDVVYNEPDDEHPLLVDPTLACVLAQQCWLNAFVFSRSSPEEINAHRLAERILASEAARSPTDVARLSVLACYDGLMDWRLEAEAIELAKNHPFDPFIDLLMLQVAEPMEELGIAAGLGSLGVISGAVSHAVWDRYEQRPHPRWVSIDHHSPAPVAVRMSELIPAVDFSPQLGLNAPRVLVAGCGTGRTLAVMPTYFTNAVVTGVDLSRKSLAYGARMMSEFGYGDSELYHADILSLSDWSRRFDIIECGGVLHHMEDPMAGWRVLEQLLEPGGLMRISLYSELARRPVVDAREFIARKRLGSTAGDIRTLRQRVFDGEVRWPDILNWPDFWNLEACRDLFFPVQEHRFTIPQIADCVAELGLEFLGFEVTDSLRHEVRKHAATGASPTGPAAPLDLEAWHSFEDDHPRTFIGMYQFWLRKPSAGAD